MNFLCCLSQRPRIQLYSTELSWAALISSRLWNMLHNTYFEKKGKRSLCVSGKESATVSTSVPHFPPTLSTAVGNTVTCCTALIFGTHFYWSTFCRTSAVLQSANSKCLKLWSQDFGFQLAISHFKLQYKIISLVRHMFHDIIMHFCQENFVFYYPHMGEIMFTQNYMTLVM